MTRSNSVYHECMIEIFEAAAAFYIAEHVTTFRRLANSHLVNWTVAVIRES